MIDDEICLLSIGICYYVSEVHTSEAVNAWINLYANNSLLESFYKI